MSDRTAEPIRDSAANDPGHKEKGHVAAHVESAGATDPAADKPAPHDTPHEVEGSPVRSPPT